MSQICVNLGQNPNGLSYGIRDIPPLEVCVGNIDAIFVEIEVCQVEQMKILVMSFFEFLVEDVQIGIGSHQNDCDSGGHIKWGFKLFHLSLLIIIYSL